jgi:Zn-dependent protease with chaperone function
MPQTNHSILYFDGKTSQPQEARIEFNGVILKIFIINTNHEVDQIKHNETLLEWDISQCSVEHLNSEYHYSISYGDFPKQQIQLQGKSYEHIIAAIIQNKSFLWSIYQKLSATTSIGFLVTGISVIVLFSWLYVRFLSPWVGEQVAGFIPKHIEKKLGEASINGLLNFGEVDSLKSIALKEFVTELNMVKDYDLKTYYVDSDITNAMAAPGGQIVVFDGIVQLTDCYDQLAGLLSHEAAHVNQRHSLKSIGRSVSVYFILSAITGDVAGSSGIILEQAAQLNQLSNSRKDESEADEIAISELVKRGMNPIALAELFDRLQNKNSILKDSTLLEGTLDKLEFLSTHPNTDKRIELIKGKNKYYNLNLRYHTKLDSLYQILKQ